jgi:hypothetical protein
MDKMSILLDFLAKAINPLEINHKLMSYFYIVTTINILRTVYRYFPTPGRDHEQKGFCDGANWPMIESER